MQGSLVEPLEDPCFETVDELVDAVQDREECVDGGVADGVREPSGSAIEQVGAASDQIRHSFHRLREAGVYRDYVIGAKIDVEVFGLEVVRVGRRVTEADRAEDDEQV